MEARFKNLMKNAYFQIDKNTIIGKNEVIGIFDLDKITVFKVNRNYLSNVEQRGKIINTAKDIPKSFVLCCEKGLDSEKVYVSQPLALTLKKRALSDSFEI